MSMQSTFKGSGTMNCAQVGSAQFATKCDASLVEQAKSGSSHAFGELYERHRMRIYRAALRILRNEHDAEDVVQRSFQSAFTNLHRFREDSAFATWVTRITINESLMLLRQRRVRQPLPEDVAAVESRQSGVEVVFDGPTPEEILCENERRATVLQAVAGLRKTLRVVVHYRELQGLTSAETARVLGLTVGAVKARAFQARRLLRKHFQRKFADASFLSKLEKRKA